MTTTILQCDCIEYMRTMADKSVDVVITDPPYDERTHKGAVTERETVLQGGIGNLVNSLNFSHLINHDLLVREFLRIAKRWSLCFCTFEDIRLYRDEAWKQSAWVRSGVWDRVNAAPQFTGDRPSQAADGIAIFHPADLKKQWNGGGKQGIWRHSVEFGRKQHPTQKPLSLMRELVLQFSNPGETVFDPFMGSGSTGIACNELGRNFIGIEKDPAYFKIAQKRIAGANVPLFVEA
jgi:site-specific DNA-methyltransferase (adenine-specific)